RSPIIPNPVPCTIWPANHPAMRPTTRMTRRLSFDLPAKYRIVDGLENGQHRPYYEAEVEDRLCKIERARTALTGPGRASVRAPDLASRRLGRAPLRFANRSPAREARPN